jgi:nucleotide-binding universal stress UspA family protein
VPVFHNVLVGVDGRSNGRDAITLASRLADPDATLTLAHVHGGLSHLVTSGLTHTGGEASQELLERERSAGGVDAQLISVTAPTPGEGLHQQAERQGADLLVVGSSDRAVFGRAMLGDDTRAALNGAPCAVAIAARGYAEQPSTLGVIGVAYNGTPESEAALAAARTLAARLKSTISALDVVSLPAYALTGAAMAPLGTGEMIKAVVDEARDRINALPHIDAQAVYGIPGEELATYSEKVDLLIVGSRGYGPIRRLILGSTSNYLQRHARCCLLVMPRASNGTTPAKTPVDPNPTQA